LEFSLARSAGETYNGMILGLSLTFSRHARFPSLIHTASLGFCFPLKSATCGLLKKPGEVVQQVVPQAISRDDPKKYLHNLSDSIDFIISPTMVSIYQHLVDVYGKCR